MLLSFSLDYLPLHPGIIIIPLALLAVAFYVVYILTPFPVSNLEAPETRDILLIFSFYRCKITQMCNINLMLTEITPWPDGARQQRRILFRGKGGSDFIFCHVM